MRERGRPPNPPGRQPPHPLVVQLSRLRVTNGDTQKSLAAGIGSAAAHICEIESGHVNPTLQLLTRWAGHYGKTITLSD